MFPIDGSTFLVVYLALIAAGVVAHRLIRHRLRAHAARRRHTSDVPGDLSPLDVAFLKRQLPHVAAVRFIALHEGRSLSSLQADPESRLAAWGLILSRRERSALRTWSFSIFGGLLAAGLARAYIGVVRDKPIGLLLLLLLPVVFLLWRTATESVIPSVSNRVVLDAALARYRAGLGDLSLAMGFALLGWVVLPPDVEALLHSQGFGEANRSDGVSGTICVGHCGYSVGGWSGDSGGGGSGGDGGGGGGGGGGCGGCGGS